MVGILLTSSRLYIYIDSHLPSQQAFAHAFTHTPGRPPAATFLHMLADINSESRARTQSRALLENPNQAAMSHTVTVATVAGSLRNTVCHISVVFFIPHGPHHHITTNTMYLNVVAAPPSPSSVSHTLTDSNCIIIIYIPTHQVVLFSFLNYYSFM